MTLNVPTLTAGSGDGTAAPTGATPSPYDTARLAVTLRHSPEILARIVSTLRSVPVLEMTYRTHGSARATAEITLAPSDAPRACRRLRRAVDVVAVDVLAAEVLAVSAPGDAGPDPIRS
ncbi:hypothetical protein ACIBI4_04910 [Streptomyces sp. NPDC050418]|uniref:hypothetical protein n=1 Tax=Streptomyces sp. NPDC050418 TaxID=3365612 RepID=UPI0037B16F19